MLLTNPYVTCIALKVGAARGALCNIGHDLSDNFRILPPLRVMKRIPVYTTISENYGCVSIKITYPGCTEFQSCQSKVTKLPASTVASGVTGTLPPGWALC